MHMDRERESYTQLLEFTPAIRRKVRRAIAGLADVLDLVDGVPPTQVEVLAVLSPEGRREIRDQANGRH